MKAGCIIFKRIFYLLVLILVAGVTACDKNRIYEAHVGIPNEKWAIDNSVLFNPTIHDTAAVHNIYLNIRNSNAYDYSNIFLFIRTTSPTGQFIQDTLEIKLADEHGQWLGRGVASVFFSRGIFKENVRFPNVGTYTFEITHGMRTRELEGIRDVGLRIEKVVF